MKTARNIGVIETKRDSPYHVQAKADPEIRWGSGGSVRNMRSAGNPWR